MAILFLSQPLMAQQRLERADGRWDVTFDIPDRQYRTIIDFSVDSVGKVKATTLGLPLIGFTDGQLTENRLRLRGTSPYGPVEINVTLDGDRLAGRWQVAFIGGDVRGSRDSTSRQDVSRLAVFDAVWDTINKRFYDPQFNGADWQGLRAQYRPLAEAAGTDGELVTLVRNMLGELHSSHLYFSALPSDQSFSTSGTGASGAAETAPINWRRLSPTVGYIQIKQFDEGPEIIRLVDRAFEELGSVPSLVIDVRGNPGGTLSAAMRLGDYLFTTSRPVGYFVTRQGLARLGARSIDQVQPAKVPTYSGYDLPGFRRALYRTGAVAIVTGGRAKTLYRGRVVLLIDQGCGSTTEGLASVIKEIRAATLIGRRTAGAMLSAVEVAVVGGWTLRLPEANFRTPGGVRIEGNGVEPDIVVQRGASGDADLDRALRFLQEGM